MAEVFSKGINRIWYRTTNFVTGKNVTVHFRKPDDTFIGPFSVPEIDAEGIHYLDYDFDSLGQWLGVFFENNIKTLSSIFHIVPKINVSVPYDSGIMKCQTCGHFSIVPHKNYGICDLVTIGNPYRLVDDTCSSYYDMSTG